MLFVNINDEGLMICGKGHTHKDKHSRYLPLNIRKSVKRVKQSHNTHMEAQGWRVFIAPTHS
jgi:hypothetical protein